MRELTEVMTRSGPPAAESPRRWNSPWAGPSPKMAICSLERGIDTHTAAPAPQQAIPDEPWDDPGAGDGTYAPAATKLGPSRWIRSTDYKRLIATLAMLFHRTTPQCPLLFLPLSHRRVAAVRPVPGGSS